MAEKKSTPPKSNPVKIVTPPVKVQVKNNSLPTSKAPPAPPPKKK
jgi:hypothetical protein